MANKVLLKKSSTVAKVPATGDLDYGELAINYADGKLYYKTSGNSIQSFGSTTAVRVTSNTTAISGTTYIADTSGGAFTITLPASPATGDTVTICDGASFLTTALTVGRNSQSIEGISENLSLNIAGVSVTLTYDGTTWQVYTQVGAQGGTEVTIGGVQTLTNKTISGSSNTLSNIGNSSLTNSSVTVNGTSISLGGSGTVTAAAGTLTGTELKSTVVTSSLTSVGTLTGLTTSGAVNVTYTPGSATGYALTLTTKDTQGGTGYADFLKVTNTTTGVTNPNKSFRLTSDGQFQIINSAYDANLFNLTNAGALSVPGSISINGKKAVNGPSFRAYVSTGQAITSGSQQKVTFGGETFDTDGCFASSTFTPNVEGYYQFNATVRIDGPASTSECMIILYKNGSEYARGTNESGTEQGSSFYSMQVSDIAYANGTGDTFDVRIQQTSGSNKNTTAGATISYFSGCMIRGA
jgi:hypothetical protein